MKGRDDLPNSFPYRNDPAIKTVKSESDIDSFAQFNGKYNNKNEGMTCSCLLRHHPAVRRADFWSIEDEKTHEITATSCLIPWQLKYEGVTLDAAMLEMVLSHPDYRKMGLIRKMINFFHEKVVENQYHLSFICGIPFYYRQYGYGYGIDMGVFEKLPVCNIPDLSSEGKYVLRDAGSEDVHVLAQLYDKEMLKQQFHVIRKREYWSYLIECARYRFKLVLEKSDGRPAGYIMLCKNENGNALSILESSVTDSRAGIEILSRLKNEAKEKIVISWPKESAMVQAASSLGSTANPGGQWLWRIQDPVGFISAISSVLEHRLCNSRFSGLTGKLVINLFRNAFSLSIDCGKLKHIENLGFVDSSMGADGGDLCIPADAFTRLILGYRSLDELNDAWPDTIVKPGKSDLINTLFPKMKAHIYTPYHYQGDE